MAKDKTPPPAYEVNIEEGLVKGNLLDSRVIVLGSYGWATIEAELNSTFITGGMVILQRMGYSYGKYLGMVAKRRAEKAAPSSIAVDLLIKVAKESGWGNVILNGGALQSGILRLVVRDCLFCMHLSKGKESRCHFLAGVTAGLADEVTGYQHTSREERCIGKGDNICEIVLERTAQAQAQQTI